MLVPNTFKLHINWNQIHVKPAAAGIGTKQHGLVHADLGAPRDQEKLVGHRL